MTDEDIVQRFADIMGWKVKPHPTRLGAKPEWRAETSSFEGFQASVALMWDWLGPRRRARAAHLLRTWPYAPSRWAKRHPRLPIEQGYAI